MKLLRHLWALSLLCGVAWSVHAAGPDIVAAEYYIDTDPGPGNGTSISANPPGSDARMTVDVPAVRIAGLPLGTHFLTVRFRNAAGDWSLAYTRVFERVGPAPVENGQLAAAEYYFDTDPGPGNGTPIPGLLLAGDAQRTVEIPAAATASLSSGIHFLTVRFRNADGDWSVAYSRVIEKNDPTIEPPLLLAGVELRWLLDGQAVGQPSIFNAPTPATQVSLQSVTPVTGLAEGKTYRLIATPVDIHGNRGNSASSLVTVKITDLDGDGIADSWEIANGLNPALAADATQDSDGDGLTNLEEFTRGTQPRKRDTSGDGIDDGLAVVLGLNPLQSQPSIAAALNRLAEGQVRALYPGKSVLVRDEQSGRFRLRLGVQETGDLQVWQKLAIGVGEAVIDDGDLILSFQGTEPNRFYRIDAGD